jgi:ubiquinone/menaquinone biosynthesis C-methylase UbiE
MEETLTTELFTDKSEAYAKYRPGYPDAAIRGILAPFHRKRTIKVVDVGAGTGIGSRLMADVGALVTAVEPNQAMIEAAKFHPNVRYKQANAEMLPIHQNYADLVTSMQAFHWFDFKKSLLEFNRVLKPSGRLSLVWNYWDVEDAFTKRYVDLINWATQQNPHRVEPYDGVSGQIKKMRIRLLWKFRKLPFFYDVRRYTYTYDEVMTLDELIGCAKAQSYIDHLSPVWEELVTNIRELHNPNEPNRLVYNINVFTARPIK